MEDFQPPDDVSPAILEMLRRDDEKERRCGTEITVEMATSRKAAMADGEPGCSAWTEQRDER